LANKNEISLDLKFPSFFLRARSSTSSSVVAIRFLSFGRSSSSSIRGLLRRLVQSTLGHVVSPNLFREFHPGSVETRVSEHISISVVALLAKVFFCQFHSLANMFCLPCCRSDTQELLAERPVDISTRHSFNQNLFCPWIFILAMEISVGAKFPEKKQKIKKILEIKISFHDENKFSLRQKEQPNMSTEDAVRNVAAWWLGRKHITDDVFRNQYGVYPRTIIWVNNVLHEDVKWVLRVFWWLKTYPTEEEIKNFRASPSELRKRLWPMLERMKNELPEVSLHFFFFFFFFFFFLADRFPVLEASVRQTLVAQSSAF
jgi:hypothetical protein